MQQSSLARAVIPTDASAPVPRSVAAQASPPARPGARQLPARATAPLWPVAVVGALLSALNVAGMPYYTSDSAERVRHSWHQWLRPSGYVGQSAGIVAFAIFGFLWLYPLRKRFRSLAWSGSVGRWLDVHIATALCLPLLLALHAGWRSDGLIGLGLNAMLVVCASGVIGRYLYTRIPRARSGVELTRDEVTRQREELVERISSATGIPVADIERSLDTRKGPPDKPSLRTAFAQLVLSDWQRWKLGRELPRRWAAMSRGGHLVDARAVRDAVRLAKREVALTQQSQMLDATQRIFRFWHVAHKPFAISALVAVLIHVVVVVAVGTTWFY